MTDRGLVTATCGHDISSEFLADTVVTVKAATRDGKNAVSAITACRQCREDYERVGIILHNPDEESNWIHGRVWIAAPVW